MAGYHQHPFPAYATAPPPAYGLVPYGQLHTLKYQAWQAEGRSQHLRHLAPGSSPSAGGAGGSKAGGGGGGGDLRRSPGN